MFFNACKNDDPVIPNEEELITTLNMTMISQDMTDTVHYSFVDLDGDGGNKPIVMVSALKANTTYSASLTLLNEVENPAEDITAEVIEEGDEHQVFYVLDGANLTMIYDDMDKNGNPLGVKTTITTGAESNGTMKVILRHEPTKPNNGDPSSAEGETDIEVTFNVAIL